MLSKLVRLSSLAVLALGISGVAHAQPADYRTYFTFSAPVTLPGVTLPAGKYLFRLADPNSTRRVINIVDSNGKSVAMLHTIPNQLPEAPRDPEIRFMETSNKMPPPVKTWWYPGKAIGYEFIYPRQQALQIAKVTSEPVLTTTADTKEFETADLSRIDGSGVPAVVTVEETPAPVAARGRAQQGEIGGSSATGAADPRADQRARTRTQLPRTASSMPAVMLFGALAMVAGFGLFAWPRRQY